MRKRRQSFLQGAAILGAATVLVKLIGAMFKIPLMNLIGGVGMGDFTIAYDIFRPLSALALAGLPVAVSKLVSENAATGRLRDIRRLLRLSAALFVLTGALGSALMLFGARRFAAALGSPESWLCIAALAPALFFCCLMAAYRGYYQGLNNMSPTALSQVVEALCKLGFGTALSFLFMHAAAGGEAGGLPLRLPKAVRGLAASGMGAVGAVLGVSLSTACGAAFLLLRHYLCGDGLERRQLQQAPKPENSLSLLKKMAHIALPACLGSVAAHVTSLIDLASIMNRLERALEEDAPALFACYPGLLEQGLMPAEAARFLYGAYSGIALNIFSLIPSLMTTVGVSILPAVAGAWAAGDRRGAQKNVQAMLRLSALLVFPAGCGLWALSGPITQLLYGARPLEAQVAAMLLRRLALPMVLVSLVTPVSAVLQAAGQVDVPVKLMVGGGAIKLALNLLLVGRPQQNILAAPLGTLACYAFILIGSLRALRLGAGLHLPYGRLWIKPAIGGALCALCASTAHGLLSRFLQGRGITVLAIGIGAGFYLIFILLSGALQKEELSVLPQGEKIVKILEKHGMIG